MIQKYEALLLTIPEITGDEAKDLELQLDKVVRAHSGSTVSFERWGKYKLAYEINKSDYGVYFLMRFEVPKGTKLVQELKTYIAVKLNAIVMRDMISLIDSKTSYVYQRPRSLEEAPTREESAKDARGSSFFGAADNKHEFEEEQ
jgi:ribosomal protein S6